MYDLVLMTSLKGCCFIVIFYFSPAPAAVGTTNIIDEKDKQANEKSAQDKVKLDPSSPVTTVLIRFSDRTSVQAKFNHSHTIADIRQFITMYPLYTVCI